MTADQTPGKHQLRTEWEQRAAAEGSSYTGVLLRNLPPVLNHYLHERHVEVVLNRLLPRLPQGALVLDLGCGYGRISSHIKAARPDIQLVGVDFAFSYCQQFTQNVEAAALCADLSALPFAKGCVHGVVAVTALMYIPAAKQEAVMDHLLQRVQPQGFAIFIDPGAEFLGLVHLINGRRSRKLTSGAGIGLQKYDRLGTTSRTQIVDAGGFVIFSLFLPLLYLLQKRVGLVKWLLNFTAILDQKLGWRRFTLHRWMLLKRLK